MKATPLEIMAMHTVHVSPERASFSSMPYKKLILLAPCHGLEDFPLYHTGEDAASLLACWTAMWHPLLLHAAVQLPQVQRCDYPPEDLGEALLLLPRPCESELDADLPEKATRQGATLLRGMTVREEILSRALKGQEDVLARLDPELAGDFMAFGFAFLQVELLTQQMRYASCIDQTRIARTIKEAAAAALDGDLDLSREKLTSCHDALTDERSHYYPVDVYLLDLTLLAPVASTLGEALRGELQWACPQNYLACGQSVEMLARTQPEIFAAFQAALQANRIGFAGGEWGELPLPLMTLETGVRQLLAGRQAYTQYLGFVPTTYGRRVSGIHPALLYGLRDAGFTSAVHLKFDEGQYPESSQCKTKWHAEDGTALDAYARPPLDASSHDTFLRLPSQLSETMDTDHVAARLFVHWPGQAVPWYDDLRRCHRYGAALGRFVRLDEFFGEAGDSGTRDLFRADDYRYPYLSQAVARRHRQPISRWVDYWERSVRFLTAEGVGLFAALLGAAPLPPHLATGQWVDRFDGHEPDTGDADAEVAAGEEAKMAAWRTATLASLAKLLGESPDVGRAVINPMSFPRRLFVETDSRACCGGESVYAAEVTSRGTCRLLVDVPAMGFASFHEAATPRALKGPRLADGHTLKNEFFVATIDSQTGALRSFKDHASRSTRISQQVGLRISMPKTGQPWVDRQSPVGYSAMIADAIEVTDNGKVRAEITARGRLLAPNGDGVGAFVQRYQVTRGSRVLVIELELQPQSDLLLADPWDSYYACRWAFGDESAVFRVGRTMQSFDVSRRRFEAPLFVEIDCGNHKTTVLAGGLPFHRRVGQSKLDTLLCVRGENARTYRLGVGVDLPSPLRSALDLLVGDAADVIARAPRTACGWLLHVDAKNVVISSASFLEQGRIHLRLVETEGRRAPVRISCCKPIREAHRASLDGVPSETLEVRDGVVHWQMEAHQVSELVLHV